MTERRPMSPTRKLKVFENFGGRCHICERRIRAGEPWDAEHVVPLALGGADDDSNLRPAHKACHGDKTRTDAASWSKAKRVRAKHVGAYRSSNQIPGSRGTPWKRKISGETVRRT